MRRWFIVLLGVGCLLGLSGCQKQLFPRDAPQTPYSRYMKLHGEDAGMSGAKNHAGMTPATLRARLAPLDQR